jgi:hypothetical protein
MAKALVDDLEVLGHRRIPLVLLAPLVRRFETKCNGRASMGHQGFTTEDTEVTEKIRSRTKPQMNADGRR